MKYRPEGICAEYRKKFYSLNSLKAAAKSREILEARVVLCDSGHNLHVDLGGFRGIIPRNEGALGIIEGTQRDIALLSKVNRTVCFRIMGFTRRNGEIVPVLSRRNVQLSCLNEYINSLVLGDIIPARVTKLEGFGAFIDIGAGLNSLIPIEMLSVSRINNPAERLKNGQVIKAVLRKREPEKLTFSMKELLGTWEENASFFQSGETVTGIVRSVESYGVFVELTPNLAGLADCRDGVKEGDAVSVYIKSVSAQKLKVKLAIIENFGRAEAPAELKYFISEGHIDRWDYSPPDAQKQIFTVF